MSAKPFIVDSHCHLNYKGLNDDIDLVIQNAKAAGVTHMLAINARLSEYEDVLAIAKAHDNIWATVGSHPHEAENEPDIALDSLLEKAANPKVIGIGETGLDYYYDNAPRDMQRRNFLTHIKASRETGLPLIVHTRDADDDTIDILQGEYEKGAFPGVIHCFTASRRLAEAALEIGFYISLSGILTFNSAKELQETAKDLPLERLLVETDSPFLAPVPHRGKRCEPAYTADTARFLANLKDVPFENVAKTTTENFFTLFSKASP